MINANYTVKLPIERPEGEELWLYIGPPHAQTEREIEILVSIYPDSRQAVVFHAMPLGSKYRRYREENPSGD